MRATIHGTLVALILGAATATAPTAAQERSVHTATIASFDAGTFLESIAVRPDGNLLVVDHTSHALLEVTPDGQHRRLAILPNGAAGVALDLDETVVVTSGFRDDGASISVLSPDGAFESAINVPGSMFLNGVALLEPGIFLAADSLTSRLYRIDIRSGEASVWLEHEALAPLPDRPRYPGANGIKVVRGAAHVTNSAKGLLLRIPIVDGAPVGMEILAQGLVLDDIAVAKDGTIYGATHPNNSVVRIDPGGDLQTVATEQDGLTGATAVAFGVTPQDHDQLYAVTNGGVYFPPETGVVRANIVRIEVGETGHDPIASLSHVPAPKQVERATAWLVRCYTSAGEVEALRTAVGPSYLRFLELASDRILIAGQYFADTSDAPTSRYYVVGAVDAASALRLLQASPYYRSGLYSKCEAGRFVGMLGTLLGGVAWPETASTIAE